MRSRVTLGLTLLLVSAVGVAVERSRDITPPSTASAVHSALASELEAGSDGVESLSQTALEDRLDQLERELSAGSSSFPSSVRASAGPASSGFGLD